MGSKKKNYIIFILTSWFLRMICGVQMPGTMSKPEPPFSDQSVDRKLVTLLLYSREKTANLAITLLQSSCDHNLLSTENTFSQTHVKLSYGKLPEKLNMHIS